jgi:hypothetical protein
MQQPLAQVPVLQSPQMPSLQVALPVHALQVPPSCPQAALESPATQAFPLQQPSGQEAAVHTH